MQPFLAAEAIGAGSDRPAVTCSAATSPDAEQTASCGPLSVAQATRADVDGPPRLTLALSRQHAAGLLSSPEASDVEIHIPQDSRAEARVSFDGRNTCRMTRGSVMK